MTHVKKLFIQNFTWKVTKAYFIKNVLREHLGQVLVVGDFSVREDLSFNLSLNMFYPTLTYDKGGRRSLTEEDKNIPMRITMIKLPDQCRHCSVNSLSLLLLARFANSGLMRTEEGWSWTTLDTLMRWAAYRAGNKPS